MIGLVFLLIAGVFIIACRESRQGKWAGCTTVALSAAGIVGLTVVRALGVAS